MHTNKLAVIEGARSGLFRLLTPNGVWTIVGGESPTTGAAYFQLVKIPLTATKAELAPVFKEMKSMKFSQKAISMFTGVSQSYVSKKLRERIGG